MNSLRHSVFFSLAQRYLAFAIQFIASIILARLLTPAETGIFSLAAAIISIAHFLRDFGVSEYLVQERELTPERVRTALGLTLAIAWTLALMLYLGATPLANYYHEAGVRSVIHVLVWNFVLLPFGTTAFAILNKQMAFKLIFWIQSCSAVVSSIVSVVLAWLGFSYMSMAWAGLAGIAIQIILLILVRPRDTLIWPSFKDFQHIGRFGGLLTIGRLTDQIARRAPDMIIGSTLGFHAVGIFSKGTSLFDAFQDFFLSGINRVATPAFAQRLQKGESAHDNYLKGSAMLAIFQFAFFSFLLIFASPLIFLFFGPAWMEAVPLLQIACCGGLLTAPYLIAASTMTANGQISDILRIQFFGALVYLPVLFFAAHFSLIAVAIAGLIGTCVKVIFFQRGVRLGFQVHFKELLRTTLPSMVSVVIASLAAGPMQLLFQHTSQSAIASLSAGASVGVMVLLGMIFITKHPLAAELKVLLKRFRKN